MIATAPARHRHHRAAHAAAWAAPHARAAPCAANVSRPRPVRAVADEDVSRGTAGHGPDRTGGLRRRDRRRKLPRLDRTDAGAAAASIPVTSRVSVPLARSVTRTAPLASTAMSEIFLKPDARISTPASELMPVRFARFAPTAWPWSPSTPVIVPTINRAMIASGACCLEICMRILHGRRGRAMAEQRHCPCRPHLGVAGS